MASSSSRHKARKKKKGNTRTGERWEEEENERRGMEEREAGGGGGGGGGGRGGGGGGGRVVGFERPSLLQDLRNILQEYPDNGQIFKEMFQNAEDAGAREVKIVSVTSPHPPARHHGNCGRSQGRSPSTTAWRPPLEDMFSMPGLIVYNDALFNEEDWRGIRKLHDSVKVKDPLKVGRFGLGFKSVFHLTDHPIIVSGSQLLFMDPFREEKEAIFMTPLSQLWTEERQGLRHALRPLLGKLTAHTLTDDSFGGTVFWFPLRQRGSDLSETLYTHQRVRQLKQALRTEIHTMLLFLKRLERIEIYACDLDPPTSDPVFEFSVGLEEGCVDEVRRSREAFIAGITTPNKTCPARQCYSYSHLRVQQQQGHSEGGGGGVGSDREDQWVVVHFHQGLDDMSTDLRDLCQRKSLSHRPYVGVAARLNAAPDARRLNGAPEGQIFSFLPLPPENPSPSGLPVHVHGFFELSQNRCHVKWPTGDGGGG
ncbi:hypothetical protein ACOMHN_035673 [Nucella lapillus]